MIISSKILEHLNNRFCDNKIKYKIVFLEKISSKNKEKGTTYGYYDPKNRKIAILKDSSMIDKLDTLIHEFTHAYQHQILGEKLSHNKKGGKMFKKFKKECNKIIKVSIKGCEGR